MYCQLIRQWKTVAAKIMAESGKYERRGEDFNYEGNSGFSCSQNL